MTRNPLLLLAFAFAPLLACTPAPLDDDVPYAPSVEVPACQPNNDGVITREELPFVPGLEARIRVAEGPIDVDVVGTVDESGKRVWDFSRPDPSTEPLARIRGFAPGGFWFDGEFPDADFIGPLEPASGLLGAFAIDDDGVHLLGAASAEEDPESGQTLLVYDAPIPLYPFPLALGTEVTTTSRASDAMLLGLPVALDDTYEVEVTGQGTLVLPDLVLANTLRVTLRLERTLVVGDARQVTHVFVHECLGEVARVTSEAVPLDEELPDDFDTASAIWRLSL